MIPVIRRRFGIVVCALSAGAALALLNYARASEPVSGKLAAPDSSIKGSKPAAVQKTDTNLMRGLRTKSVLDLDPCRQINPPPYCSGNK